MNWFLVLLFWNPMIQDYDVAYGWSPLPYATHEECATRLAYVRNYLPNIYADIEHMVDCVRAQSQEEAVYLLKTDQHRGLPI